MLGVTITPNPNVCGSRGPHRTPGSLRNSDLVGKSWCCGEKWRFSWAEAAALATLVVGTWAVLGWNSSSATARTIHEPYTEETRPSRCCWRLKFLWETVLLQLFKKKKKFHCFSGSVSEGSNNSISNRLWFSRSVLNVQFSVGRKKVTFLMFWSISF